MYHHKPCGSYISSLTRFQSIQLLNLLWSVLTLLCPSLPSFTCEVRACKPSTQTCSERLQEYPDTRKKDGKSLQRNANCKSQSTQCWICHCKCSSGSRDVITTKLSSINIAQHSARLTIIYTHACS